MFRIKKEFHFVHKIVNYISLVMLILTGYIITNYSFSQSDLQRFAPIYRSYSNVLENQFRSGSPTYYVVQPGDTYYSIAQKFLVNPQNWAQSWIIPQGMSVSQNGQIQPGSIVVLSKTQGAKLRWFPQGESALAKRYGNYYGIKTGYRSMKLLPVAWGIGNVKPQILPPNMIDPFKVEANVVPYSDIANAPIIAGFSDNRLLGYADETIYIRGNIDENIREWYVYRPAQQLIDPETYASLGYVSERQGIVTPIRRAPDAYEFLVVSGISEFERGSRLVPVERSIGYKEYNYQRPNPNIFARVVGIYDGSELSHHYRNVVINRGSEDGVKRGDVFNLLRYRAVSYANEIPLVDIPIVGYGRIYVYRTEPNTSFALILEGEKEIHLYDYVRPDKSLTGGAPSNIAEAPAQQNQIKLTPQVYSTPIIPQRPSYRISR